jgi:hypothetical protein
MMFFLSVQEAAQCVLDSDRSDTAVPTRVIHPELAKGLGILERSDREESRLREGKIPVDPLGQGVKVRVGEDAIDGAGS